MHESHPSRDALRPWLEIALAPGSGPVAFRDLTRAFGSPAGILAAGRGALDRVVGPALACELLARDDERERAIDAHLSWAERPGHRILTLADPGYPPALLQIADPPPLLFAQGDPARLGAPSVAIVGSRSATRGGLDTAEAFARALGDGGLTVVSGLALGIDGAAHRGALATSGGTVAVLGTGPDVVYPREHRSLAAAIVDAGGVVISEAPLGSGPRRASFPKRNRLIAGLSLGVLVVEAALRSGSLITARLACEFGREVFAIPGSIHSPLSKGCHELIRQGARLVESAQDVLEELPVWALGGGPAGARLASGAASGADTARARVGATGADSETAVDTALTRGAPPASPDPVLDAMGWDPVGVETIAARIGAHHIGAVAAVAARLPLLELEGRIDRLPDGRYQRRGPP